ncbi:RNase MRP and nuclear RNase P subunit [Komagataella phaffii CBS 7435]|uniref:Ribonuclease P/MRP protein subunit POP5 n=2 Tax=Komagataella phaffii TaxID=460519 RepID=C4R600_KOMPG|nr:Subunit of both RNase MRP, which cleaves pre-rRNA, and nuclear RNase P, which cleaves tRNA precursor [Komagataella phaffii GS115]AOA63331.1 GQ67_04053T0 [Komagataella phaffii]CAH2449196.1 RNase MRP and nuclear RNase P subunit [Komagataella phaffii CBS 7435]AOA68376.1 GQ68_04026T0 [Komagataella phaffii GS115]CAY70986.1 Subunit of both RNase MRP, which cleaves pre-rRNA, and nuclear RNase P, which cleaves tRNA precursor [Komagataella phaffii GS115]SCV12175.1 RNase MRP and nuclear RNase P subun
MVRLKNRYILFDILYPQEIDDFSRSKALVAMHKSTSSQVNPQTILIALRNSLKQNFGDHIAGIAGSTAQTKYFSNKTSTGIIRCPRDSFRYTCAALSLITHLEGQRILIRIVRISGTIRTCERYAVKKNKETLTLLHKDHNNVLDLVFGGNQKIPSFDTDNDDDE